MITRNTLRRWLLALLCCAAIGSLSPAAHAAKPLPRASGQLTVMIMIRGQAQERSQVAENTLAQAFLKQGYTVIDAAIVTQSLRRNTYLLKQADTEAAKRLGSGVGADIVVSGEAKSHVVDKTYTLLEGKKVILGQGDVSVKAVLSKSGSVIVAENASQRKPFDTTGQIALQMAAESAAGKLIEGIEAFLQRDTTAYRLVVQNVNDAQSVAFQENLRNRIKGVREVDEHSAKQDVSELNVSVEKAQDLPFKQSLFGQLSGLGLGPFEVVAREGEIIYLRKAGDPILPQQDTASRQSPSGLAQGRVSPTVPSVGTPKYQSGYRKSWAVVIGINEYQQWPKLKYAVNDARSIERLVKEIGFNEVIMLLDGDATQQRILRTLGDELYAQTEDDDRVFIFYAGHGQTQDLPANRKDGYIIPVDGDLQNYYSTAISMQQLQGLADRLRAKHIFYAMDACFSGLLLQNFRGVTRNDSPMKLTISPARQVLTAGAEGEKVVETGGHGLFTKSLLSGLTGNADLNKDGYITATELSQHITAQVLAESRNSQNPLFGRLGDGQGEFVFELK
jgi:caspase domain-containing protein